MRYTITSSFFLIFKEAAARQSGLLLWPVVDLQSAPFTDTASPSKGRKLQKPPFQMKIAWSQPFFVKQKNGGQKLHSYGTASLSKLLPWLGGRLQWINLNSWYLDDPRPQQRRHDALLLVRNMTICTDKCTQFASFCVLCADSAMNWQNSSV